MIPPDQPTVQPPPQPGAATMQPGVTAPPPGAPIPPPMMPATPHVRCYLKEFTVTPTVYREGMIYRYDLKTIIKLNIRAPHRMVFHVTTNDPQRVTCTDIVILKDQLDAYGGIRIIWGTIQQDTKFELKASSDEDPETVLHARLYLKKKLE